MNELYEYDGAKRTLKDIAGRTGISYSTLRGRILVRRWSLTKALEHGVRPVHLSAAGTKVCAICQQQKSLDLFHAKRQAGYLCYGYCLACSNDKNIARAVAARKECIAHYSRGTNKCELCPESRIWVLDLDHINGRDPGERKRGAPLHLARYCKKRSFPEGFRVLCRNCNWMEHLRRHGLGPFREYAPLKIVTDADQACRSRIKSIQTAEQTRTVA